jgi:hypothetical protein
MIKPRLKLTWEGTPLFDEARISYPHKVDVLGDEAFIAETRLWIEQRKAVFSVKPMIYFLEAEQRRVHYEFEDPDVAFEFKMTFR